MRRKKRYVLFDSYPSNLPEDSEFLFQNERGYVFRLSPKSVEKIRGTPARISGSIRNLKVPRPKTRKSERG